MNEELYILLFLTLIKSNSLKLTGKEDFLKNLFFFKLIFGI